MIAVAQPQDKLDAAADILTRAVAKGQVAAAVLYVRHRSGVFARSFGTARSVDELFLLGSISKTMTAAALMTLYDQGRFQLEDPVRKFLPEFTGEARDRITVRQLLTHVSGLPDQVPENQALRQRHAPLADFVAAAIRACPYHHCYQNYIDTIMIASAPRIMVWSLSQPRQIVIHPGSPSRRRPKNPPSLANSRKNRPTVN
jgi:CubicO group peptidase (beta-lactamase class C family)